MSQKLLVAGRGARGVCKDGAGDWGLKRSPTEGKNCGSFPGAPSF